MRSLGLTAALLLALVVSAAEDDASRAAEGYTVARFDVPSTAVGSDVPTSALLPPGTRCDGRGTAPGGLAASS